MFRALLCGTPRMLTHAAVPCAADVTPGGLASSQTIVRCRTLIAEEKNKAIIDVESVAHIFEELTSTTEAEWSPEAKPHIADAVILKQDEQLFANLDGAGRSITKVKGRHRSQKVRVPEVPEEYQ
jgi:hypothetical protein